MWKFVWKMKLPLVLLAILIWLVASIMLAEPIVICSHCGGESKIEKTVDIDAHGIKTYDLHCPRCGEREFRSSEDCPTIKVN